MKILFLSVVAVYAAESVVVACLRWRWSRQAPSMLPIRSLGDAVLGQAFGAIVTPPDYVAVRWRIRLAGLAILIGASLAGCATSAGVAVNPTPLPTIVLATPTPNDAGYRAQVQQSQIAADTERLRIEATATANAMQMQAQNAVMEATQQAQAAEYQRIAESTAQAVQSTAEARSNQMQIAAQQQSAAAAAAQASADQWLYISAGFFLVTCVVAVIYATRRRADVDMAQVMTGHYLPKPVTVIGRGGIVRSYQPPQWGVAPPNTPEPDPAKMLELAQFANALSARDLRPMSQAEFWRMVNDFNLTAYNVGTDETGAPVGLLQVGTEKRAYRLSGLLPGPHPFEDVGLK